MSTTAVRTDPPGTQRRITVARIATAVTTLNVKRGLVEELKDLVAVMEPSRLVPLGSEHALVDALEALLSDASDRFASISTGTPTERAQALKALEELLDAPDWIAAATALQELRARRASLDTYVKSLVEERGSYRLAFSRFHAAVEEANRLRLEVDESDRQLATEVEGRFRSSDREFEQGRYDTAAVAVELARQMLTARDLDDPGAFEEHTTQLEQKIASRVALEGKMGRRAELFVISGAQIESDVAYKVMLRRPGHAHLQETNLYDDVVVLDLDQVLFRDTVERITGDSVAGIRSPTAQAVRRARRATPDAPAYLRQLDPDRHLEMIGRRMYDLLIPDAMQRLLDETPDFALTITSNNPEMPWELMHDGSDFLCLQRMFARMPTGQTFPRRSRDDAPTRNTQKRALLICSGSKDDLPEAIDEISDIESSLKSIGPQMAVTTVSGDDVTSSRLTDELSLGNYDIVHYAGHAGFDSVRPEQSFLLLPNGEKFRAERVQRLLDGHPIVFLNACESSRNGPQSSNASTGSTLAQSQGLAAAFVYGGAKACVGSLWPVFDDTARAFGREFYRCLIQGSEMVGEALRHARLEVRSQHRDRVTWAAYALYGEPSHRLNSPPIN